MTKLAGIKAELYDGCRATLPGWIVAHMALLGICLGLDPGNVFGPLSAWDTHWYLFEATRLAHGGAAFGTAGGLTHFFPLTPLAVAGLALLLRLPVLLLLFAFCWLTAVLLGALVYVIAVRETQDRLAARRAAWLSQLAPGAFALVMGYSEPLAGVLAALYFLAVRRERTGWAVAAGFLAGLSRPTGGVLALFGLIESVRAAHHAKWARRAVLAALARTAAPLLGLGAYLGFCQLRYHDWILPYAQQMSGGNRGKVVRNPVTTVEIVFDHHAISILLTSLACAGIGAAALAACRGRLPHSYTAWSAVLLVLAVTSPFFTSEPRYLAAILPLLITVPAVLRGRRAWYLFAAVDIGLFCWVSELALGLHQVA